MANGTAPVGASDTTLASLLWPRSPAGAALRAVALMVLGSCLLTVSAKINVPGPVPMTLQTLAVMVLGATLGMRLSVGAVAIYVIEGALGLPVFANTPPLAAGLPYLLGPTGGFLAGFAAAAAMIGYAADRGLMKNPLAFALVLCAANVVLLGLGCAWLALAAQTAAGATGIGFGRAFQVGVEPFWLANAIKLLLAAVALPLVFDALSRLARR